MLRRRRWVNLNGRWEFGAGDPPRFDGRIQVPFCPESARSGIGEIVGDVAWYRRSFDAPEAEVLLLHFGAVDYRATVWVNGVEVAAHEGGHTPFSADITRAVRERGNELVVRAEDPLRDRTIPRGKQFWEPEPEGIFYTPTTGIWQTVWLEPLPARHLRRLRLRPDLDSGSLAFEVGAEGRVELVARLDGRVAGTWSGLAGSGTLRLDPVVAWHPDSPRLYDLEVRLEGGDSVAAHFGLRSIATEGGQVLLNGERFVQRLVLDQGYFPDGLLTAPSDAALRRDIRLARALGFNGVRKHQKAEDPRWLYWADRLGFLVWSEAPSFHRHSPEAEHRLAAEWAEIVRRDEGHPAVVTWVVGNESFGLGDVDAGVRSAYLDRLRDLTDSLDGTRPVVTNDGWEHARSDLCTVHDYSPPEVLAKRYRTLDGALRGEGDHAAFDPGQAYTGQPVLVSEFGGLRIAGSGGWGWLDVPDAAQLASAYRELVEALMGPGPVEGFCYTQLADVQQERNGLLTADRRPKVAPELISAATGTRKRDR